MGKKPFRKKEERVSTDSQEQEPEVVEAELVEDNSGDVEEEEVSVHEFSDSTDLSDLTEHLEVLPADESIIPDILPKARKPKTSDAKDVVPYDTLQAYLREISQYKPLSREEERELAVRFYEHKDRDALYRLITSNLWLAVKIARDYEKAARNVMDLIQEGNIGLLEAVKNFDPYREVRFPSYAVWWIKAYIIRYVIANWRMVKIGTTQAQRKLFFNLKRERDRLEREGFSPQAKLIAQNLDVKESDVIEMEQRLGGADVSVDAPLPNDFDSNLLTILPDPALSAEESLGQRQLAELLQKNLSAFEETLNQKERVIFSERLLGEEKSTLQDLADQLSLSKERVRQIEVRIKEKLKTFLIENLGSLVEMMMK